MSALKVHNTATGNKEDFKPLSGNKVLMYSCGPTVYDLSHIGHARKEIVFDVIQRYLRSSGYEVTYVRNITDVDDKIIARAKGRGVSPDRLAREYTYTFWKDMHALNVQSPDFEPRCTEYVPQMLKFIAGLIAKGHAYAVDGDVYFDVTSFKEYGKLKGQTLEDMMVGAREGQVRSQDELKERKRHPADFALWKGAATDEPGWDSAWGRGRPGWHLECSAMIEDVLGRTIDIHGGGIDLIFPHHENELAQSEALHGEPFVKYWLHNNFVQVNAEKMAKSLGNFTTINDVLAKYSPDAVRMLLLQTHYRSPIDFSTDSLDAASNAMGRLIRAARSAGDIPTTADSCTLSGTAASDPDLAPFMSDFIAAMDDDFNTPRAVAILFILADRIFTPLAEVTFAELAGKTAGGAAKTSGGKPADLSTEPESASDKKTKYASLLFHLSSVLGFTLADTNRRIDSKTGEAVLDLVLQLRQSARDRKDFQTSDQIRDGLQRLGVKINDTKGGSSTWESS